MRKVQCCHWHSHLGAYFRIHSLRLTLKNIQTRRYFIESSNRGGNCAFFCTRSLFFENISFSFDRLVDEILLKWHGNDLTGSESICIQVHAAVHWNRRLSATTVEAGCPPALAKNRAK